MNKKYYILYKTKRDKFGNVIDLQYLKEYTTLSDIVKEQGVHFYNVKAIINEEYSDNLKTFKDMAIIKDIEY